MTGPARLASALMAAVVGLVAGCGGPPAPTAPEAPVASYTVRGRIVSLPDPARPAAELIVHHEPIPSFMSGGEVIGMDAMAMPFPIVNDSVSLAGLAVGDAVTLTFDVTYDATTLTPAEVVVTGVSPLPAGVRLSIDPPGEGG